MRDDKQHPANPTMFAADERTIFYPTAPGRVYAMDILTLADCNGSDEDFADSTTRTDIAGMVYFATKGVGEARRLYPTDGRTAPPAWPMEVDEENSVSKAEHAIASEEWADALEQWADWCDRDSVRLDSLDEVRGRIVRAA